MINIGIDLDDTILDTIHETHINEKKFCKKYGVTVDQIWNENDIKDKYLSEYLEATYLNASLKKGVKKCLDDLYKKFNIFIITARNNRYVENIESKTIIQLEKLGIVYDKIIFDSGDKVGVCKENEIMLIIDNRKNKVDILNQNDVNAILYDEKSNDKKCINDWSIVDENTILSFLEKN